ncbi:hypothetical protein ACOSP7_025144 [Xanthoceras sorbifolium]
MLCRTHVFGDRYEASKKEGENAKTGGAVAQADVQSYEKVVKDVQSDKKAAEVGVFDPRIPVSSCKISDIVFPQDLSTNSLGESSGTLNDFVVDENDSNYLVEEESQVLGGNLCSLNVSVKGSSMIFSQSEELSSIQPAVLLREEPEVCSPKVKKWKHLARAKAKVSERLGEGSRLQKRVLFPEIDAEDV